MAVGPGGAEHRCHHDDAEARMLTILSWLCKRSRPARVAPQSPLPAPDAEDAPCGCGWFDSSHELHSGLLVTEHLSPDAVAAELPLIDWLELHLSGWRAPCTG
jgi:hypothetical protein